MTSDYFNLFSLVQFNTPDFPSSEVSHKASQKPNMKIQHPPQKNQSLKLFFDRMLK